MVGGIEPRPLKYDPYGVDNPSHGPSAVGAPFHRLRGYRLISLESVTTIVTFIPIDGHRDLRILPLPFIKAAIAASFGLDNYYINHNVKESKSPLTRAFALSPLSLAAQRSY
jgi:hypothetical protein